jgi:hypothetical protein
MRLAPRNATPWRTDGALVREVMRLHFSGPYQTLKLATWDVPVQSASLQAVIVKPTLEQPATYSDFLEAARRVLYPRIGTALCSLADWRSAIDFVGACRSAGWAVCEMVPRVGADDTPSWFWICAHPGPRCRAVGTRLWDICSCGNRYTPRRRDQRTCGRAKCRRSRSTRPGHPVVSPGGLAEFIPTVTKGTSA